MKINLKKLGLFVARVTGALDDKEIEQVKTAVLAAEGLVNQIHAAKGDTVFEELDRSLPTIPELVDTRQELLKARKTVDKLSKGR